MNLTYVIFILSTYLVSCKGDIPCNKIKRKNGYICVCNSKYCDTITSPEKLQAGDYHFYYTSKNSPGFNHEVGHFKIKDFYSHGVIYNVNTSKIFQTIQGFGGSFTDSFGIAFNSLSYHSQENLLKSLFSENGLEYTVCRIVLGSSDFSSKEYTYLPAFDPYLKTFNLTEDDYRNKISLIKRSLSISKRKIKFLGSTWTSPSWMRNNKYLLLEFQQIWADYYIKTLDAFKNEGIEFWGLTTGNEPFTSYSIKILPCLIMFPEEQREWIINNLGPALKNANYSIKIIVLDDQRSFALWWLNIIMRDSRAKEYVHGIGLHWYMDKYMSPAIMDKLHEKFPKQEILYTESSINNANDNQNKAGVTPHLGSWERAEKYANSIIENLNHWTTTYIDWNIGLDLQGGPNLINVTCDASIIVNKTADEFYKQPIFYVIGHFSKFILPGSRIFDISSDSKNSFSRSPQTPKFNSSMDDSLSSLNDADRNIQFSGALNPDGSRTIIFHNPKKSFAEITVHDPNRGYAFIILEPKSISTLLYW